MLLDKDGVIKINGGQIIGCQALRSAVPGFQAVNPVTGEILEPQFGEATLEDVDHAVAASSSSFDPYRKLPMAQRAAFLESIGTHLTALGEELVSRAHAETGLPRPRLEGELNRTVNQLKLFAGQVRQGAGLAVRIDRALPERAPVPKPDLRTMQVPLGPVAIFGAGNFPLAFSVAGGDTASALAAGCPVVVKGHPAHPGTCELAGWAVVRAARDNGIPPGVFSLLQAQQTAAGAALVQHPQVRAVAFTGSLAGGRALFNLASARPEPVPVYAEMGSVNPVIFLPQVLAERGATLAAALAESVTLGVGQFCTAPGLIVVIGGAATEAFLDELEDNLAARPPGVMLHGGIKQNFLTELQKRSSVAGVVRRGRPAPQPDGCQVTPVLLQTDAQTLLGNPALADEVFGPSALVVVCDSVAELLVVAESLPGLLTATLHGTDAELRSHGGLAEILERKAGRLVLNGFPTGVEVCAAMHHGGPYPATTDSRSTSVGVAAMQRFLRPVCYQNFPQDLLPGPLRDRNPERLWRLVDGQLSCEDL